MSDQMSTLPEVVSHLATRCLCWGLGYIWPKVNLTKVVTKLGTRCLHWGYIWPQVNLTKVSNTLGHKMSLSGRRVRLNILLARQPASLPSAFGQPTSNVKKCQPDRLQVGQIVGGGRTGGPTTWAPGPGYQHSHWFPLGEWPTWPRPGKWQKWALQPLYIPFTLLSGDCLQFCIYVT